ncbi:MAG TPA: hypothetical protein VK027_07230 [Chitinophagaceae bacterium]|nr:hypothetical protein [Chitinophagaceae bacterium]
MDNKKDIPHTMKTLSSVIKSLKEKGIKTELKYEKSGTLTGFGKTYQPQDLSLIKTYRFEGISNPDDNSALYLFEDKEGKKGYIIDIYGNESNLDDKFSEFLRNTPSNKED